MDQTVSLSKMTHDQWVAYCWINITTYMDKEPVYLRNGKRPIEELQKAEADWKLTFYYIIAAKNE